MKYAIPVAALAASVSAFPTGAFEALSNAGKRATGTKLVVEKLKEKRQLPGVTPPFDPALQYVSTTGQYAWEAPGPLDQRGPCPGLNAMANHGYLPHNGVGTLNDFIDGTAAAFGMGYDIASFLAVYGAIFDGDLTSYSIGGAYPSLTNGLLLGEPEGLSGSHNKYENDVSPIAGDLFVYGNDYKYVVSQFTALYNMGQENGDSVDLDVLTNYRVQRFQESIEGNPYFFNAPFSGVIASPAAWSFIYRFMANKSEEHPEGLLTGDVLKSFYAMSGDSGSFEYTYGHERIPDNWYKRHPVDYYTIPYFSVDNVNMLINHPQFGTVGGNTGTAGSFVGIDPANLTYGVYNSASLLEGNNLMCYGLQGALFEAPDILSGLFTDINPAMDLLGSTINNITNSLGCPTLNNIDKTQFQQYPGYTKLSKQGTYN